MDKTHHEGNQNQNQHQIRSTLSCACHRLRRERLVHLFPDFRRKNPKVWVQVFLESMRKQKTRICNVEDNLVICLKRRDSDRIGEVDLNFHCCFIERLDLPCERNRSWVKARSFISLKSRKNVDIDRSLVDETQVERIEHGGVEFYLNQAK